MEFEENGDTHLVRVKDLYHLTVCLLHKPKLLYDRSSWGFLYMVIIGVVTAVVVGIATATKFYVRSNMLIFFFMLFFYGLSIIGASFAITPFFNKAQVNGK